MAIPGLHISNYSYILVAHNVSFAEPEYSEHLDQEVVERKKTKSGCCKQPFPKQLGTCPVRHTFLSAHNFLSNFQTWPIVRLLHDVSRGSLIRIKDVAEGSPRVTKNFKRFLKRNLYQM